MVTKTFDGGKNPQNMTSGQERRKHITRHKRNTSRLQLEGEHFSNNEILLQN